MKTSASADLCLEKVLNTCSRSANQMPGTENVLDFFFPRSTCYRICLKSIKRKKKEEERKLSAR